MIIATLCFLGFGIYGMLQSRFVFDVMNYTPASNARDFYINLERLYPDTGYKLRVVMEQPLNLGNDLMEFDKLVSIYEDMRKKGEHISG